MSLKSASRLIAAIRKLGIEIRADAMRGRILWRPKDALPHNLYAELLDRRAEALALLCAHDPEVTWRSISLRKQIPPKGPIPPLHARAIAQITDRGKCCGSCGDPLIGAQQFVCLPCQHALWLTLMDSD
jgi:hypothetical protein